MFIDARKIASGSLVAADICIIGGGAAGITLARELSGSGQQICVLESGDFTIDPETQLLAAGRLEGQDYWPLHASRLRYFGGTTNHWGGECRHLNQIDFEKRSYLDGSGWPTTLTDMWPFYERAQPIAELGPAHYEPGPWVEGSATPLDFGLESRLATEIIQKSPPTRFGEVYREELAASVNVNVYLNANVKEIRVNNDATTATEASVQCLKGNSWKVVARRFVLALGGIENARLLLLSNSVIEKGLGNSNDLVGRYFADHNYLANLGFILLNDATRNIALYQKGYGKDAYTGHGYLAVSDNYRREKSLLGVRLHFQPADLKVLRKRRRDEDLGEKILRNMRKLTGYDELEGESIQILRFGAWAEPAPNRNSRVYLGDDLDALGQRQIVLDWRSTEQEKHSLIHSLRYIAEEIGQAGLGRVRIDINEESAWPWQGGGEPGLHHMGTTRMAQSPSEGVVDANCKVHGIDNLWIAGSSVFPTYGTSNPTLTILAMTLRLADHLLSNNSKGTP